MKLRDILNEITKDELSEIRQYREKLIRDKFKVAEDTVWINLYHGTSEKNANNIVKTGFRDGAWFATDYETSDTYSKRQAHGGKPYVMMCRVYIGSLVPSGDYLVSQEPLASTTQGYLPKDLVKNVNKMR